MYGLFECSSIIDCVSLLHQETTVANIVTAIDDTNRFGMPPKKKIAKKPLT